MAERHSELIIDRHYLPVVNLDIDRLRATQCRLQLSQRRPVSHELYEMPAVIQTEPVAAASSLQEGDRAELDPRGAAMIMAVYPHMRDVGVLGLEPCECGNCCFVGTRERHADGALRGSGPVRVSRCMEGDGIYQMTGGDGQVFRICGPCLEKCYGG